MTPHEIALSQYGIKEIAGGQDNPLILEYFNAIGFDGQKLKDETSWCSAFVNWCCKVSGYQFTGKLNARSWLETGQQVNDPQLGDIVIFWRDSKESWKGHVGFYVTERSGWIYTLGGNQSSQVKISGYPSGRLLGYRRPLLEPSI
jgi:uncharacterized protein (TIGR02594 family)